MLGFAMFGGSQPEAGTGRPPAYTQEQVEEALWKAKGKRSLAAKLLRCSRSTLYNYLARYPAINARAIKLECREEMIDIAEGHVDEGVRRGEFKWVRFFLSTQGKDGGWTLRPAPKAPNEGQIPPGATKRDDDLTADIEAIRSFLDSADQMGGPPLGPTFPR